ncbi:DUF4129 domain-containing protein [Paramicrobacterium agarici]|uniref:Uncharacterized protein DUF4129 n=1 Tax=Paramicrobacterium agarici TaxID=630514 RepID=A0A2A9DXY1_9MICO|nr:DUF4129 domain-containing protein [Microbacterium agarici]PFG30852.1 uncharacterized protein DUF4129 [Microbacterium agarici]TQO23919.1 uncharacterized protein DUF4129 [Microbacterium agarici]
MSGILAFDDAPPLTPGRDEAYDWLVRELSKPEYTAAQPSLIDRIAAAIRDWFLSLVVPGDGTFAAWIPVLVVLVIAAAIVAAIMIWGVPRRNRSSQRPPALFGDDDTRSARDLRAAARDAAQAREWDIATLEAFRALARGLDERTVVTVLPGTTARSFAASASAAFPTRAESLHAAASDFDSVRYLQGHASREQYEAIAALDAEITELKPARTTPEVSQS